MSMLFESPSSIKKTRETDPYKKRFSGLDAVLAAHILKSTPSIQAIEVFGSISRDGKGNDIDLILIVPEEISLAFLTKTRKKLEDDFGLFRPGRARTRKEIALSLLGHEFADAFRELVESKPESLFDVFLLPADWKNRTEELELLLTHKPIDLFKNMSQDAIRVV